MELQPHDLSPAALLKMPAGWELTFLTGRLALGWNLIEQPVPNAPLATMMRYRVENSAGVPLSKEGKAREGSSLGYWHETQMLALGDVPPLSQDRNAAAVLTRHIRNRGTGARQAFLRHLTSMLGLRLGVDIAWPSAEFFLEPADYCRAAILLAKGRLVTPSDLAEVLKVSTLGELASEAGREFGVRLDFHTRSRTPRAEANLQTARMEEIALLLRLAGNNPQLAEQLRDLLATHYAAHPEARPRSDRF